MNKDDVYDALHTATKPRRRRLDAHVGPVVDPLAAADVHVVADHTLSARRRVQDRKCTCPLILATLSYCSRVIETIDFYLLGSIEH